MDARNSANGRNAPTVGLFIQANPLGLDNLRCSANCSPLFGLSKIYWEILIIESLQ
jgi:hypothetical protein